MPSIAPTTTNIRIRHQNQNPNPEVSMEVNTMTHQDYNYDQTFISSIVQEEKRFLWEIKDFPNILRHGVCHAMNFEFEMGRLGSMERHLPRKSRFNISLNPRQDSNGNQLELLVQLLHPQDKVIFYRFQAKVMEYPGCPSSPTIGTPMDDLYHKFREAKTGNGGFKYPLTFYEPNGDTAVDIHDLILTQENSLLLDIHIHVMENYNIE